MAWLKIHTNITRNPKTARLARLLKIKRVEAVGYLVTLWTTCLDVCEDGDLSKYTNQGIADLASWEGDENLFFSALDQAGWIDIRGVRRGGRARFVYLHDWYEHVERYLQSKYKNTPEKWEKLKAVLQQHASFKPRKLPPQNMVDVGPNDTIPEHSPSTEWPRVVTDRAGIDRLVHAPGTTADALEAQEARRAANDAEVAYMMGGRPASVPVKGMVDGGSATRPAREADSDASQAVDHPLKESASDTVRGHAVVSDPDGSNRSVIQVQERLFETEGLSRRVGGRDDEMREEKEKKKKRSLVKAGDIKVKHLECVFLTMDELQKLRVIYSENYLHKQDSNGDERLQYAMQKLNDYIMARNKTRAYKSHYHVLRGWPLKSTWEDEQRALVRFHPKVPPAYRNDLTFCRDCEQMVPIKEWGTHPCNRDTEPLKADTIRDTIDKLRETFRMPPEKPPQSAEDRTGQPGSPAP